MRQPAAVATGATRVTPVFVLALLLSAFLLFWIQPLVAKMVMPQLGGAPAVWNTCLVFFQTALLAGYAYAHGLARRLTPGRQLVVHAGVLLTGAAFLPVAVASGAAPDAETAPVGWLLAALTASIAVPFLALSATAPLLQGWFVRTRHPHAADPYFLYGASNLGSVGALAAFPWLLESLLTVDQQSSAWSGAYAVLIGLIGVCGLAAVRGAGGLRASPAVADADAGIGWRRRLGWIAPAAVPSSLLIGVTTHLTTDIAAVPFLWVAPLGLYLLTFIVVFSLRPPFDLRGPVRVAPLAVLILAVVMTIEARLGMSLPAAALMALHLAVFTLVCLMCHFLLYRRRPAARGLTQFYLCLSLGGALGGAGTALLAPRVFDGVYEYPVALAACLLVPGGGRAMRWWDPVGAAAVLVLALGFDRLIPATPDAAAPTVVALGVLTPAVVIALAARGRPTGFALCVAALVAGSILGGWHADTLWRGRSFFGAYRIVDTREGLRLLYHGTTVHGAQWIDRVRSRRPATYYADDSPVAEVIRRARVTAGLARVGVVGLGVGSLACHRGAGETWRFYEIDPLMAWIASGSGLFRFLEDCAPDAAVVIGDGRLSLSREAGDGYDLLILDAFTSDAIPVHLLTREAFGVYLARLASDGVLLLHVSNRHVDLRPPIGRLGAAMGLAVRTARKEATGAGFASMGSDWVAIARHGDTLDRLGLGPRWTLPADDGEGRVWTDQYSNLVDAIIWW